MKRLALVLVIAACGKGSSSEDPGPPFQGPVTADLILASKGLVNPLQPWGEAFARLQAKLGQPTKVDGKKYYWAAMRGDDCAYFYVEQEDGKEYKVDGLVVGGVQQPKAYGKKDAIMNRGECLELLGKGGVPEDPNTPAPPADGKPVAVGFVLDNAIKGRSKWAGKQIVVEAVHAGIGGQLVSLKDRDKDDKHGTLGCIVGTGDTAEKLMGQPVVARGTVKMQKMVSGTGEPSLSVELEPCTVADK